MNSKKFYNKNFSLIIPARTKSTRLPNKVLKKINGITILEHVYNLCKKKVDERIIFVATPDFKIQKFCIEKKKLNLLKLHKMFDRDR